MLSVTILQPDSWLEPRQYARRKPATQSSSLRPGRVQEPLQVKMDTSSRVPERMQPN
jgi:hypothetical protein